MMMDGFHALKKVIVIKIAGGGDDDDGYNIYLNKNLKNNIHKYVYPWPKEINIVMFLIIIIVVTTISYDIVLNCN